MKYYMMASRKPSTIDALTEFVANVLSALDNGGNCL